MAVTVTKTSTKVNLKYPANTKRGLTGYTLSVDVKNGAEPASYYAFGYALTPMVDADDRSCEAISLTITETIE